MATQFEQSTELKGKLASYPREITQPIEDGHEAFMSTFDPSKIIQVGDQIPAFRMTDATGKEVDSASLLAKGPLLITFYRGEWCAFCNIAIAFLAKRLPDFQARGVTLVAITPELPNHSMTMTEKHALQFPVLTDLHNKFAKQLGIVYDQSSAKGLHDAMGIDLNARNGEDTWEVPIPASLLVDESGIVRNAHVDPDFRIGRLDPKTALEWVDALRK
ncbi:AhpC-TSA-domain-containing protein [Xylariaceae sp. FL1019]|nr:AhpC-TSA-domain-containing protein [Xylariaceae sp. FL1019]